MIITMSDREEEERKSADPPHRISLADAVAAAASKHDFPSASNPNLASGASGASGSKCS